MTKIPPIYFYLPTSDFPEQVPDDADHYWVGFRKGIYCWTLQTYLNLKNRDFPCKLVDEIPAEGITFAHWDSLPAELVPSDQQLIVCFQADRSRHPFAQVHIVQNREGLRRELMTWGDRYLLAGQDYFMPLWSQPGLIPRDLERGDRFENLCFFGLECNLLPEFQAPIWQEQLKDLGVEWRIISAFDQWNDYSQVDGILAVRSFQHKEFIWKPATKLFNAWHAGVPAILGCETAYRAERKSDRDYLEVESVEETLKVVQRLKTDHALRQAMIQNGFKRAEETTQDQLSDRWINLIQNNLIPSYSRWEQSSSHRANFLRLRRIAIQTREQRKQLQNIRNQLGIRSKIKSLISTGLTHLLRKTSI